MQGITGYSVYSGSIYTNYQTARTNASFGTKQRPTPEEIIRQVNDIEDLANNLTGSAKEEKINEAVRLLRREIDNPELCKLAGQTTLYKYTARLSTLCASHDRYADAVIALLEIWSMLTDIELKRDVTNDFDTLSSGIRNVDSSLFNSSIEPEIRKKGLWEQYKDLKGCT